MELTAGKVAVVTGAASGIGLALAGRFARAGLDVVLADVEQPALQAASEKIAGLSAWRWVLGVNLWGVIHGIRAFLPVLAAQGEGHIVNTASVAANTIVPLSVSLPLVAAAAGMAGATEIASAVPATSNAHDIARFMHPSRDRPPPSGGDHLA